MILEGKDRLRGESIARKFNIKFEGGAVFVGIHEGEKLLGFACGEMRATAVLQFIFVEARYRGSGIAPKLLEAFCNHAKSLGLTTVEAECTSTGQMATAAYLFLSRHGFGSVSEDMAFYTVPLDYVIQWGEERSNLMRPRKGLTRWCDVPKALQNWCIEDMKKHLPRYLLPTPWLGQRVEDLSYCYISEDGLKANVTVTEALGQLHLESLYCQRGFERMLYRLLILVGMGCSKYKDEYELIQFTCITKNSNRIFIHIAKEWNYEESHLWFMKREI